MTLTEHATAIVKVANKYPELCATGARLLRWVRDVEMLEMRSSGMTFDAIGQRYGITRQAVHQAIKMALEPSSYADGADHGEFARFNTCQGR